MSMNFTSNIASGKPVIREAANMGNDGGGGNLGYMMQGENQKRGSKKDDTSIFTLERDTFGAKPLPPINEPFSIARLIAEIILAIKSLFK
jgi:hypothetical protein